MSDDRLVQSRSTQPAQAPLVGNRGTGEILYHFKLPTTDKLRELYVRPDDDFHVAVWLLIFGPEVRKTKFVAYGQYTRHKWVKGQNLLDGATFNYRFSSRAMSWMGLMPRLTPFLVTDANGNTVEDSAGYGEQAALIEELDAGRKDVTDIVQGNIGFDLGDGELWKSLDPFERSKATEELAEIVAILGDLDDAAYVELLRDLPPVYRGYRKPNKRRRIDLKKLREFRVSLKKLKEETESRARKVGLTEFDSALETATLVGCHELYFKEKELEQKAALPYANMALLGSGYSGSSREAEDPEVVRLRKEIQAIRDAKGFRPDTLGKLTAKFRKTFEKRAAAFSRKQLLNYQRLFEHHLARTDPREMMAAIRNHGAVTVERLFDEKSLQSPDAMFKAIAESRTAYQELIRRFPLMQYTNFWTIVEKAHKDPKKAFSIAHFNLMVAQTRKAIAAMLKELEDSSYAWKGDIAINAALQSFGMYADKSEGQTHNTMLTDIVQRKMRSEKNKGIFKGILLAILALALSFSGVGILVAGGVALSLYDVYSMIGDQAEIRRQNLAGFSSLTPPSDFWILLAVAGAGADVGGLVKLMNAGKAVETVSSARALDDLLIKAEVKSMKARKAAHAARTAKADLDNAFANFKKVASSAQSIGAGFNEMVVLSYNLGRLGLKEFRHFILELSHRKLLAQIPDTADFDAILRALPEDSVKQLRKIHSEGIIKARKELEELDELIEATRELGEEVLDAEKAAAELWARRSRKGVSRNPKDTKSPFNTLREAHQEAIKRRDRLRIELKALKAELRRLRPPSKSTPADWGRDAEHWVRVVTDRKKWPNKRPWPDMQSQTTKSVDSVRAGPGGAPEVMQSKAIVHPTQDELVKKIHEKIRQVERNLNSHSYKDLVRQFNDGTIPVSSVDLKVTLPQNWRDPTMRVYLEIPVISHTPLDVDAARAVAETLFRLKFPPNAILNVRVVTEDEIVKTFTRAATQ
ncbi:MAG: hypothetical protein ABW096_06685 [Candidatus Thiodiazotropha sp.]